MAGRQRGAPVLEPEYRRGQATSTPGEGRGLPPLQPRTICWTAGRTQGCRQRGLDQTEASAVAALGPGQSSQPSPGEGAGAQRKALRTV